MALPSVCAGMKKSGEAAESFKSQNQVDDERQEVACGGQWLRLGRRDEEGEEG